MMLGEGCGHVTECYGCKNSLCIDCTVECEDCLDQFCAECKENHSCTSSEAEDEDAV